jgi:hypothetical protein
MWNIFPLVAECVSSLGRDYISLRYCCSSLVNCHYDCYTIKRSQYFCLFGIDNYEKIIHSCTMTDWDLNLGQIKRVRIRWYQFAKLLTVLLVDADL